MSAGGDVAQGHAEPPAKPCSVVHLHREFPHLFPCPFLLLIASRAPRAQTADSALRASTTLESSRALAATLPATHRPATAVTSSGEVVGYVTTNQARLVRNPLTGGPAAPGAPHRHRDEPLDIEPRYQVGQRCLSAGAAACGVCGILEGPFPPRAQTYGVPLAPVRTVRRPCLAPCRRACMGQARRTHATLARTAQTPWTAAPRPNASRRAATRPRTCPPGPPAPPTTRPATLATSQRPSERGSFCARAEGRQALPTPWPLAAEHATSVRTRFTGTTPWRRRRARRQTSGWTATATCCCTSWTR